MPTLPDLQKCFGCGSCANACPVDAISMEYVDFFLTYRIDAEKCVSCGKCERSCPSLNPMLDNEMVPAFYAFCAQDDIRSVSSSGGMFTALAQYVFDEGGVVCAAAFDEDLRLRHQFAENMEGIDKFRGSKYLQSETGDCYARIKKLLDRDTPVLFVGTPCQVAGLRCYLGKPYERLLTADLLCHGTPSQLFFDGYVDGVSEGRDVADVSFRDKRFGWNWSHIVAKRSDGTEHVGSLKQIRQDPYMLAFNKNLMMRDTCYDCMFCSYPRQGDITIGDLWESAKLDKDSNDKKGTSFVFVNNAKGQQVYSVIEKTAKYSNRIDWPSDQFDKIPNRVKAKTTPSPNRGRFLELLRSRGFAESVEDAMAGMYDIGLPTVLYGNNIGSVLTYWALYNVLTDMGYSVRTFEKPLNAPLKDHAKSKAFVSKWLPSWAVPVRYATVEEMRSLNSICRQFVVGSDQIYLESMSNARSDIFFLQYAAGNKKRMAYASSFGGPGARGSAEYYERLRYYLNKFDKITCREDDGVAFANGTLRLDSEVKLVLDPVFLCDFSHYQDLIDSVPPLDGQSFVSAYVVKPKQHVRTLIDRVASDRGIDDVKCAIHLYDSAKEYPFDTYELFDAFPIERTLRLFHDSDFIVTDSYHGVCFAIMMRKDFLAIPRDFKDRFTTLLKRLGLTDRIIDNNLGNYSTALANTPIDYDSVYDKLDELVQYSRNELVGALTDDSAPRALDDLEMALEYIKKQKESIESLKKAAEQTNAEIETLRAIVKKLEADSKSHEVRIGRFEDRWKKLQQTLMFRMYKKVSR